MGVAVSHHRASWPWSLRRHWSPAARLGRDKYAAHGAGRFSEKVRHRAAPRPGHKWAGAITSSAFYRSPAREASRCPAPTGRRASLDFRLRRISRYDDAVSGLFSMAFHYFRAAVPCCAEERRFHEARLFGRMKPEEAMRIYTLLPLARQSLSRHHRHAVASPSHAALLTKRGSRQ